MMTHKERMLRAARGQWADRLPFAPRLDLWYNAQVSRGTLPARYRNGATTRDIADDLGVGYHAINPDFRRVRGLDDKTDRPLGIYNLFGYPFKAEFTEMERVVRAEGPVTHVEYRTPVGTATATISYTEEMRQAGASVAWVDEPVIKSAADYRVVGHIFRHLRVTPDYDNYAAYAAQLGERSFAVGYGLGSI